ncbi:hypothetical protein [Amycolatopsis rifamycinica]|nr:hypothetical protein [Amycolatopsis rifamycinica]
MEQRQHGQRTSQEPGRRAQRGPGAPSRAATSITAKTSRPATKLA